MPRKRTDPVLRPLRAGKKAGITRQEAAQLLDGSARQAARKEGWSNSLLAMTLALHSRQIEEVYGPDPT